MNNYLFRPLDGLRSIKNEEVKSADTIEKFSILEGLIKSKPDGRVTKLALLFYFISVIQGKIPFYVKGGIIMQYYLNDKARMTNDLDIITNISLKEFIDKLNNVFDKEYDGLSFKINKVLENKANEYYYYDTFNVIINVYCNNNYYDEIVIDGIYNSFYERVDYLKYDIPSIIKPNSYFYGVRIEYVMAEKIMAITNELKRPYKHLIDVYNLISCDIDIINLKKHLDIILASDNCIRTRIGKNNISYEYFISDKKVFNGSFILDSIQAGINIDFEEMRDFVNSWMKKNL